VELFFVIAVVDLVNGQFNPNQLPDTGGIVHLFEWKWKDIAAECERFLSVYKYGGVQVSPPNENAVIAGRPWYERLKITISSRFQGLN
jgi:alpha-amylase